MPGATGAVAPHIQSNHRYRCYDTERLSLEKELKELEQAPYDEGKHKRAAALVFYC